MTSFALKLNRRITVQQRVAGADEIGQPSTTWQNLVSLWANIHNENGTQKIKSDKEISIVNTSIRIRYRSDLNAGMRVTCEGIIYEIKAILPDKERQEYVDFVCEVVK